MSIRTLCRCWYLLCVCCPLAAAQTALEGTAQWETVYKAGGLSERRLQFESQLERTLVFDNLTIETLLGFAQALETPKTASSTDERFFELSLEWKHELGVLQACWEQRDVRFPEASSKDQAERTLRLGADVDLDPLALEVAFEDDFEQFPGNPGKDRNQRITSLKGALDLGEARLQERAELRGISFPHDFKKAEINELFETNLNFPLWGTSVALARRDRIEGFPNDPKKDKHQTLLQIEAQHAFAAWELETRWQQELEQFPLDPMKHKRVSALELEGTLSDGELELMAAWAQEHATFERDPPKDSLVWAGEATAKWFAGDPTLEATLEAAFTRFPRDPAKNQDERTFSAEVKWGFDAFGPFYPQRFSVEMQTRSKRFPASSKKDELRWEWACQLQLILLEEITLDFTVAFEEQRFSNDPTKPATSRSAFELEFAADF